MERITRLWRIWVLVLALGVLAPNLLAQDSNEYLIETLEDSVSFRLRAQAALSLGRLTPTPEATVALEEGLFDAHPAVRMASAASLGKLAISASLPALYKAKGDDHRGVRRAAEKAIRSIKGKPRYYIAVGDPGASQKAIKRATLGEVRDRIERGVALQTGVELAPREESYDQADRALRRSQLRGYHVESSISRLQRSGEVTRADVMMILATYPGRDMRATWRTSAKVSGLSPGHAEREAIRVAVDRGIARLLEVIRSTEASTLQ